MPSSHKRAASFVLLTGLVAWSGSAAAQEFAVPGPTSANIDVQNFQAVPSPHGVFGVESAQTSGHLQVSGGVLLNFAKDPLVLVADDTGEETAVVSSQLAGDAMVALGLFDSAEVGLALPIYFVNSVDGASLNADFAQGATIGDLRLRAKYALLSPERAPVGVAPYVQVGFPTGDDAAFTSSGGLSARPGLILDVKASRLLVALNVSANLQGERQFANIDVGNQLLYGLGAQVEVVPSTLLLGAEVFGASGFKNFLGDANESPLEGLGGIKYRTPFGVNLEVAGGAGLVPGIGSPAFRVVGGLRYAAYDTDLDDDGIANADDACPEQAEDRDQFEDSDGCPDLDNDNDKIPDATDNCPMEVEDIDRYEDEDGCPDENNDQDALIDTEDQCPDEAGPAELQGCPDPDRDKDGMANDVDPCPDDAEDKDGFQDEDGCPEPDNDEDGVPDASDRCPEGKEDVDGFEDTDGCPELDNDKDGVPDAQDKCPLRKGDAKWAGCPGKQKVVVVGDELKILEKVFFDTGKASIQKKSFGLLDEVAETIRSTPNIQRLEVQGHTDDVGPDNANLKLSQERAESVRRYLIEGGVAGERLVAKGYGETQPAIPIEGLKGGAARKAREENRRVQFKILEQRVETKVIEVAPDSE